MGWKTKALQSAYNRKYRLEHKAQFEGYHRKRALEHPDDILKYRKKYYKKNRAIILKEKKKYVKQYHSSFPWVRSYRGIVNRCQTSSHPSFKWYGGRGIKRKITCGEVKTLWFRDQAESMKRPSIDRIDSNGNYEFKNCRFIELSENTARANRARAMRQ